MGEACTEFGPQAQPRCPVWLKAAELGLCARCTASPTVASSGTLLEIRGMTTMVVGRGRGRSIKNRGIVQSTLVPLLATDAHPQTSMH
eukprot:12388273-Karenia_brevis.AAC.1